MGKVSANICFRKQFDLPSNRKVKRAGLALSAYNYCDAAINMKWLDGKTQNGISKVGGYGDWLNAGGGASADAIDIHRGCFR